MKKILIILSFLFCIQSYSQTKPKLVVGIVVDQMRFDYIYRFWEDFGDGGFKKLIGEGHFFRNCQFGYLPTYTGPGHASIFTGTTPSVHGIIANDWYDKNTGEYIYCAGDGDMHTICNCEKNNVDIISKDGKMSPHRMLTTTFSDELKLFNDNSKVIGISLKDRGAILPAGHSADAAFWMDSEGKWITSSYYMDFLPEYVQEINDKNYVQKYLKGEWKSSGEFSHDLQKLIQNNDTSKIKTVPFGSSSLKDLWKSKKEFNYNLENIFEQKGGSAIKTTPFGNTILKDLAIQILKNENLGQNLSTDILSISFSSTDYIGHKYGPHSPEIKDTYIRLDKDLSEILDFVNKKIGFENVIIFVTADHGVVSEPRQLIERNIPAGYFDPSEMIDGLSNFLNTRYGSGNWIENFSNNQLFLNYELIEEKNIDLQEIQRKCAQFLLKYEWVKNTYTAIQLNENEYNHSLNSLVQRGYNQKRSGDVIVSLQTGWLKSYWSKGGTTHGSSYSYDTHIPLIFWGGKIPHGQTDRKVNVRDIAPTISTLLGISYPNGCTGNPLPEVTQ